MSQKTNISSITSEIDAWLQSLEEIKGLEQRSDELRGQAQYLQEEHARLLEELQGTAWLDLQQSELETLRAEGMRLQQLVSEAGGIEALRLRCQELEEENSRLEAQLQDLEDFDSLVFEVESLQERATAESSKATEFSEMRDLKARLDGRTAKEKRLIKLQNAIRSLQHQVAALEDQARTTQTRLTQALDTISDCAGDYADRARWEEVAQSAPDVLPLVVPDSTYQLQLDHGHLLDTIQLREAELDRLNSDVEKLETQHGKLAEDLENANRILKDPKVLRAWGERLRSYGIDEVDPEYATRPQNLLKKLESQRDELTALRCILDEEDAARKQRHISEGGGEAT
jgi:DNA repair ATPase RecN